MPGPYFPRQEPAVCGCFFPDVTRIRDEPRSGMRVLHCIVHGEVSVPLETALMVDSEPQPIPTEEWREGQRLKLANTKLRCIRHLRRLGRSSSNPF
jgi:hypothetical protein